MPSVFAELFIINKWLYATVNYTLTVSVLSGGIMILKDTLLNSLETTIFSLPALPGFNYLQIFKFCVQI